MRSHRDVAVQWVGSRGEGEASGARMFYQGAVIYSYRTTWPIARFVRSARGEMAVLMRTDTYSPSTSHHKSYVSCALYNAGVTVFNVYPHSAFHEVQREYIDRIRQAVEDAKKPRIRAETRAAHIGTAESTYQEMCVFNEFYQCGWPCSRDSTFEATLARTMVEQGVDNSKGERQ